MSKYLAFCEVFESKPALYYSDTDYYLSKIGSFVTKDFNINFGVIESMSNGEVSTPLSMNLSQPIKIGDIIQVTLVNYYQGSTSYPSVKFSDYMSHTVDGNRLRGCFVVGSIDGRRLVLKDYVEYNHSYTNVGYVGSVNKESLLKVLSIVSQREMRAFASKNYTLTVNGKSITTPFAISPLLTSLYTSFNDNFTTTNVKPFDVIKNSLSNIVNPDKPNAKDAVRVGSVIASDSGGYYVLQYIIYNASLEDLSVRIKPWVDVNTTPSENVDSATLWIQPDENADDYIRCGVVVGTRDSSGNLTLKQISEVSKSDYTGYGITNGKTILIGYSDLFTNWYMNQNGVEFSDEDKKKIDSHIEKLRNDIGRPLSFNTIKSFLPKIVDSGRLPSINKFSPGNTNIPNNTALDIASLAIREVVKRELKAPYTPISIELSENDFYNTNVDLSGEENIIIWYNSQMGAAINGVNARCVNVQYSKDGRTYTIKTSPYRGIVI